MDRYLFIALTLGLTAYGQLILKARALTHASGAELGRLHYLGAMLTDVLVLSSMAAALLAGLCWMLAVERTDLGLAYPFMALSFVIVPVGAYLLFGEPLSFTRLIGITLIVLGVAISASVR
jgi:drug/metabolite transporter (DMT)-like permease